MSDQIKKALKVLGVQIEGDKVCLQSFRKVFGGTYTEPEWVALNDYKVKMPFPYIATIEEAEEGRGRVMMPGSFLIARYGTFLDELGNEALVDAMVYQYSMAKNPRNVHYAYRLFLNGETMANNAGLGSVYVAKQESSEQAEDLIKSELYDIS